MSSLTRNTAARVAQTISVPILMEVCLGSCRFYTYRIISMITDAVLTELVNARICGRSLCSVVKARLLDLLVGL